MSERGLFITGTDTDAGKTVVTSGIVRMLRARGHDIVPMKPVQTGAPFDGERWHAPDLDAHLAACGMMATPEQYVRMAPSCYRDACSPHLAAERENRPVDLDTVLGAARGLALEHAGVVAEGAGGVLVPINATYTMRDLMVDLGWPVLVVARRGLGTISHTLLSVEALRAKGLRVIGLVFTETDDVDTDYIREDNPGAISVRCGVPVLGVIHRLRTLDTDPDAAWAQFAGQLTGFETIEECFNRHGE